MKLYLAGPMTGIPDLNFPAFHAEAARLRALGYAIVNPAELNAAGGTWHECMRKDIAALMECTGIAALPGFTESRGAAVEVQLARSLDMPVYLSASLTERVGEPAGGVLSVVLPFPDSKLNPNQANGMHWTATSGLRKKAHREGFVLARQAARAAAWMPPKGDVPLRITFEMPDRRTRDRDNLLAAMKAALDGVAESLGVDDSQFEPVLLRRRIGRKPGAIHIEVGGQF